MGTWEKIMFLVLKILNSIETYGYQTTFKYNSRAKKLLLIIPLMYWFWGREAKDNSDESQASIRKLPVLGHVKYQFKNIRLRYSNFEVAIKLFENSRFKYRDRNHRYFFSLFAWAKQVEINCEIFDQILFYSTPKILRKSSKSNFTR